MSYIGGPITSTQEEDKEREERLNKIQGQVLKPIGDVINTVGDALDTVDKEAGIPGTDLDVFHARQLLSVQPAQQLGQKLGKATGLPHAEAVGGAAGTMIAEVFTPDTLDLATAIPTLGTGVVLNRLANIPRAFNVGLDTYRAINKAQRTVDTVKTGTKQLAKTLFPPQYQPAFATAGVPNTIFSKGVNLSDDANLSKSFFEARTSGGIGFGSTKNIPFKGTTRGALDLSGMSTSKRKTEKQNFFTNIYTAGKSKKGLEAVKYARRYIFGGKAQIGGTQRSIFQMAPHHFTIDDDLAFMAANTADAPEFVKELHKFDIYPGNHPRNFIGSYHDNTKKGWEETRRSIAKLWGNNPKAPSDRDIIKFLKMPSEGKNIGKGATLLEEIDMMAAVRKQGLDKKNWSDILPEGKTIKDVKISPVVLGIDHQELIHGVVDKLPSRLKLIELIKSPKWLELAPRQRAIEVARVSRESQNVALRVNQIRLNLIKNRMNELGKSTEHWTDIQAWMAANPSEAASLSWHKLVQGTGLTVNDLIQDLPKDEVKEIATIFNLDAIPNTGELLDKLDKTPSKTFQQL